MSVSADTAGGRPATGTLSLPWIIGASSVGTLIERYDFYLYGVLALFFSKHFFSPDLNPTVAFIASLFPELDLAAALAGHLQKSALRWFRRDNTITPLYVVS